MNPPAASPARVPSAVGRMGAVEPMLATPAPDGRLPHGAAWVFEVKWDGIRALADSTSGALRLLSRNGRDLAAAYPELAALATLPGVVLDGEIVAMSDGVPSFTAIAERMHLRDRSRVAALARVRPVTYVVFDILRAGQDDLTGRTYDQRRAVLDDLRLPERVQLSPAYADGESLWGVTARHGLEGVVAKRRGSTYQPGRRSPDWVKAAHRHTRTALVGGWREESGGTGRLGAVLLGAPDDAGGLRYLGRAGSGVSGALAAELRARLTAAPAETSPFDDPVPPGDARGTHWTTSRLLVDVVYLGRTAVGRLRQPTVQGLRDDVPADVWDRS